MNSPPEGSSSLREELYQADDVSEQVFSKILETLAETELFSYPTSTSIFIVYAHDSEKEGTANAQDVLRLIDYLRRIRSRTVSDKSPLPPLERTPKESYAVTRNILNSQFRLLPARSNHDDPETISSVNKVVVCGSGVLKRYYENPFTSSYIDAIKASYEEGPVKSQQPLFDRLQRVVDDNCHDDGFHHVLTELAFLKIRASGDDDIIPVALEEDLMEYLPYWSPTDIVLRLKSHSGTDLHELFFKLLGRIYPGKLQSICEFISCYREAITLLKNAAEKTQGITREKMDPILYFKIHNALEKLKQSDNAAFRNRKQVDQVQEEILSRLTEITQNSLEERKCRFLGKLSTVPYRDRKDINRERTVGTCEWFTGHRLFGNWRHSQTSCLLWVTADPGCGKSVLARHLIDNLLPTTSSSTTCYFFFKDDFVDQKNLEGAIRCLLHQLFTQRPDLLTHEILKKFEEDEQLLVSFTGLWNVLTTASNHRNSGQVICILDALDECEEGGRSRLAMALNRFYEDEKSRSSLKFLLTSRPYDHIQREFRALENKRPTIHLSGENQTEADKIAREIDIVIKAKVEEISTRLQLGSGTKELLQDELTSVSHRTYLWVHLVFDVISKIIGTSRGRLQMRIRELPLTVAEAYEKILSRSPDPDRARRLLHIVIGATRPLSWQEMEIALSIDQEHTTYCQLQPELQENDHFCTTVRELCGLFVTIVNHKIYLLHQTAREFLIHKPFNKVPNNMKWYNSFLPMKSHGILAEICIRHLSFPDINVSGKDITSGIISRNNFTVFVEYAANNWVVHFREADRMNEESVVCLAKQLLEIKSPRFEEWTNIYRATGSEFPNEFTRLIIASYFGLERFVHTQLKGIIVGLSKRDKGYGRTALSWACLNGHDKIVKVLINHMGKKRRLGWSRSLNLADKYGQTPLHNASKMGHEVVVRQLLQKKARLSVRDENGWGPLFGAAGGGHERVVCLLIENGAGFDFQDRNGRTPLFGAASQGHEGTVCLLIEKGAKFDFQDRNGRTPLFEAVSKGHEGAVWQLLEKGANPDIQAPNGCSPLLEAVNRRDEGIVWHLLGNGANPNIQDPNGRSPLLEAVNHGDEGIVWHLLGNGANPNIQDPNGRSPLLEAVNHGDEGIVWHLLENGANPNIQDPNGRSPLLEAANHGYEGIVF